MRKYVVGGLLLAGCVAGRAGAESIQIDAEEMRRQAFITRPQLRVELVETSPAITLDLPAAAQARFKDGSTLPLAAGTRVRCVLREGQAPVRRYAVGVRTFPHTKLLEAQEVAAEWKAKGYTVRLIEAGRVFQSPAEAVLADTRVSWVVLGTFTEEQEAITLERRLQRDGVGTWRLMETLQRASGRMELSNTAGTLLGSGPTPVRLTCGEPIEVADVRFGIGYWGKGHREHRRFPGELELDATERGLVTLFNIVDTGDYIQGVVPAEISITAPLEAMKAQAVSARTEALAKLGIKHFGEPFDVCASQHCQAYGGLTRVTDRTTKAVRATRGIALMQGGQFVDAVYSANCGGHTEHNNYVWSSNPNAALRGGLDAPNGAVPFASPIVPGVVERWLNTRPQTYCGDPRVGAGDKFRWRVVLTAEELTRRVNRHYRVGNVLDIRLRERGVSGRLRRIQIIGDRDRVTIRKELNIRRVLGGLKSALFVVRIDRDRDRMPRRFTFVGGGWGHGVGLCQNGAMGMALEGFAYPAIMAHYFTDTYLQRVYE